jgi:hypothetical protein
MPLPGTTPLIHPFASAVMTQLRCGVPDVVMVT